MNEAIRGTVTWYFTVSALLEQSDNPSPLHMVSQRMQLFGISGLASSVASQVLLPQGAKACLSTSESGKCKSLFQQI